FEASDMNYRYLFLAGFLTLASMQSLAQEEEQPTTVYVTDNWRFEMRDSPCWECTISRSLPSGTALQVLRTDNPVDGWQNVRTPNGFEGWISERYLQDSPSADTRVQEAEQQAQQAQIESELLRNQFELLTEKIIASGIEVEMMEVSNEDGSVVVQTPQIIGNLATIGSQNEELLRRNQLLQNELDLRNAEVDRLTDESWKMYFLYGGGAVFGGAILCLVLTRIRPRRGYSEWA
ncbi:MAG: TIGR04211 family SH3 domain-containing protein, partial [Pseudohongiellaceae bacterium]